MSLITTELQEINIDDQLLKSYIRLTIQGKFRLDDDYSKLSPKQIRTYLYNIGQQIYKSLKKGETLFDTYYNLTGGVSLKEKYKVTLDKEDVRRVKVIINRIKKIPIGTVVRNEPAQAIHNIVSRI